MLHWLRRRLDGWRRSRRRAGFAELRARYRIEELREDLGLRSHWFAWYRGCAASSSDLRLLHWVGSIDRCGYTREACLRWLIDHYRPGDENRILLRLADWVPEIRAVAREWILEEFTRLPFSAIRDNQRVILYLSRKERLRGDPGLECIDAGLSSMMATVPREDLLGLRPTFRRYLYSLPPATDEALRETILRDPDPFCRLCILDLADRHPLTPEERRALCADRSPFVRRRFLIRRIEEGDVPDREELIRFAFDPNAGVRDVARSCLRRLHGEDACEVYLKRSGVEFYYIADCARAEHVPHFLEGVRSEHRSTRVNCLRALVRAERSALARLDLPALVSSGRRERRILLPCLPGLLAIEEIVALRPVIVHSSGDGIVSWLRLLAAKSWWHFVDAALGELLAESSRPLRMFVKTEVERRTQVYGNPSDEQRRSIRERLRRLESVDEAETRGLRRLIEFTLR